MATQVPNKDSTARDHLANERTFLAWLRTGLSLSGAGFGVIKFLPGVFENLILGFVLIAVGIGVLAFGALRPEDVPEKGAAQVFRRHGSFREWRLRDRHRPKSLIGHVPV